MGSKFEHIENSKKRKKGCFKGVLKCTVPCFITVDYTFFRNYLPYLLTIITISLQHSDSATWWRVIAYPSKPIKVVPTTVFSFIHRKLLFRLLTLMIPSFFCEPAFISMCCVLCCKMFERYILLANKSLLGLQQFISIFW